LKALLKEAFEKKKVEKDAYTVEMDEKDEEGEKVEKIHNIVIGKRLATTTNATSTATKKGKNVKGPTKYLLFFRKLE